SQAFGGVSDTEARTIEVSFRAWRIREEVGVYFRENVDLPVEDLVFPPWYGSHYRSQAIGGLYSYFFGTGSITDPLEIWQPQSITAERADLSVDAASVPEDVGLNPVDNNELPSADTLGGPVSPDGGIAGVPG